MKLYKDFLQDVIQLSKNVAKKKKKKLKMNAFKIVEPFKNIILCVKSQNWFL